MLSSEFDTRYGKAVGGLGNADNIVMVEICERPVKTAPIQPIQRSRTNTYCGNIFSKSKSLYSIFL
jgi:hypothetical protein